MPVKANCKTIPPAERAAHRKEFRFPAGVQKFLVFTNPASRLALDS